MKKILELYIHIPFCVRKCAYCDFLSFAADEETQRRYVEVLRKEIGQWEGRGDYQVSTVFFGGGTPSILPAEYIAEIMETIRSNYLLTDDVEITIECNPGTLTKEKLAVYRRTGINRISIGLQSTREEELRCLGRIHTYEEFLESFAMVRAGGFTNVNVDLMSGLPGQSVENWQETLKRVLALRPEHISAYGLMIEEGTPFYERYGADAGRREQGEECLMLPSEEEERRMYAQTQKILGRYGYERYEISNYALPGYECCHNCGYWRRVEYKGFGLGAASLTNNLRYSNTTQLTHYLSGKIKEEIPEKLSAQEQMEETMFLGLRMMEGVDMAAFEETYRRPVESVYGEVLEKLQKQGLLRICDGKMQLTDSGIDVSNYVLSEFIL